MGPKDFPQTWEDVEKLPRARWEKFGADVDTTILLHNLFAEICESLDDPMAIWEGEAETELTHKQVFAETACESLLTLKLVEPMTQFASFNCVICPEDPNNSLSLSVNFEDVGYLSPLFVHGADGGLYFKDPTTIVRPDGTVILIEGAPKDV